MSSFKELVKSIIFWDRWRGLIFAKGNPDFVHSESSPLRRRDYKSYDEYIDHQSKKLNEKEASIREYDVAYEEKVKERYAKKFDFKKKTMLCLAARLGGEVRAFKSLGAIAIGIDIEPGANNQHVLHGDFHSIKFPTGSFDYMFTNALDHAFDLDKVFKEAARVLAENGLFIIELAHSAPGEFESLDISDHQEILKMASPYFELEDSQELVNEISFVSWKGSLYTLKKRNE